MLNYENETAERIAMLDKITADTKQEELRKALETIEGCYLDFVSGVLISTREKPTITQIVFDMIKANPNVTTNEIGKMVAKEIMGY